MRHIEWFEEVAREIAPASVNGPHDSWQRLRIVRGHRGDKCFRKCCDILRPRYGEWAVDWEWLPVARRNKKSCKKHDAIEAMIEYKRRNVDESVGTHQGFACMVNDNTNRNRK